MVEVTIYTSSMCGFCRSAKELLKEKGVGFHEIDVTFDPAGRAAMSARANGRRTVPQIFFGDTHIGGCDDLYDPEALQAYFGRWFDPKAGEPGWTWVAAGVDDALAASLGQRIELVRP